MIWPSLRDLMLGRVLWFSPVVFLLVLFLSLSAAQAASGKPQLQLTGEITQAENKALILQVGLSVPPIRFTCDASPVLMRRYLQSATMAARDALQAMGYFNARIQTHLKQDPDCAMPTMDITPGPRVHIAAVDVVVTTSAGDDLTRQSFLRDYLKNARPAKAALLNQSVYVALRDGIIERVRGAGYLDADWRRHELLVDPKTNTAEIHLDLDAGSRYHIGKITIEQTILKPELAQNLVGAKTGDTYSTQTLVAMNQNLASSQYFSDVRVRPQWDQRKAHEVPITIRTLPNEPRSYELRVGYGTDTGARFGGKITQRYVNRSGHSWKADLSLAQRKQTLGGTYSMPKISDPLNQHYDLYEVFDREQDTGITTLSSTTGLRWVRNFNSWTSSLYSEYLVDRSQFGTNPAQTTGFWLFGARLGRQELNDPLFPTKGFVFSSGISTAAKPLLSSTSLLRAHVMLGGLYPVGKWVFKARTELGGVVTPDFNSLPKSLRFFAGGDQSVRGYAYQSLGPIDSTGQVIGGQYLFTASAEVMHPVYGRDWWGAAFVDTGNAFDALSAIHLNTGAGIGIRWRSPVGMVRVDVAYPFDGNQRTPRLHLGIGTAF
ncbi:autotransporter assembly complex family protein [Halothiobacillus sp.]|uniref:autotransporter assembly complex protein TamA n=1 Tax=Halothiobacillus sp. TaxID=1891311 RepID=UPI0026144967|nr:autotransporter assembly complex family protein [Halothiobacillus sp.]